MASGITDDGAAAFLAVLLGITTIETVWVGLANDEPGVAMDGAIFAALEPTDPDYERIEYDLGVTAWGQSGHFATNLDPVTFPVPSVDWGLINHFGWCSAATNGLLYAFGEFLKPEYVQAGWDLVVPPGGMILSVGRQDASIQV